MKLAEKKFDARLALYETGRNVCFCSSSPPTPQVDPAVGQAAAANAEIGKKALDFNKQVYEENKPRQAAFDALTTQVVKQQQDIAQTNQNNANQQFESYKQLFQPVESQVVSDAMNTGDAADQEREAGLAGGTQQAQYASLNEQNARRMASMGINPNSGKWQSADKTSSIMEAADKAGTMNNARIMARDRGISLRAGAANFGRGLPNAAASAYGIALTGGNSAVGNSSAANGMALNNASQMNQGFGTAMQGNTSAGNLYLGQYNAKLGAWNGSADAAANSNAQIGQGVGAVASIAAVAI